MKLTATRATPLFWLIALLSLGALALRFDEIARIAPAGAQSGALAAVTALIVLGAHFTGMIKTESTVDLPLWMRLPGAVRAAFGLSFTYLAVVALQTWDVSLGPINPTPPASFPLATRAQFFAMMTVGMFFPNYLASTQVLVPALLVLVKPMRRGGVLGAVGSLSLGALLAAVVVAVVRWRAVGGAIAWGQQTWSAADAAVGGAISLGMILGPVLYGILSEQRDEAAGLTPQPPSP